MHPTNALENTIINLENTTWSTDLESEKGLDFDTVRETEVNLSNNNETTIMDLGHQEVETNTGEKYTEYREDNTEEDMITKSYYRYENNQPSPTLEAILNKEI